MCKRFALDAYFSERAFHQARSPQRSPWVCGVGRDHASASFGLASVTRLTVAQFAADHRSSAGIGASTGQGLVYRAIEEKPWSCAWSGPDIRSPMSR